MNVVNVAVSAGVSSSCGTADGHGSRAFSVLSSTTENSWCMVHVAVVEAVARIVSTG